MKRLLILCPLKKELQALEQELPLSFSKEKGGPLPFWRSQQNIFLALSGHGKTQSAVQSMHWIQTLQPDLVLCCGAAGGLHSDVEIGEVVVGTKTVEHDYLEGFSDSPPLPSFAGDAEFSQHLKGTEGVIASGDEDILSTERAREVAQKTGALCVAWEGAGVARAARFSQCGFAEIRAITDLADGQAPQDFAKNLSLAMKNLARALESALKKLGYL